MKIAIDGGPLTTGDSVRGIGVYVRELAKAIQSISKDKTGNSKINVDIVDISKTNLSDYNIIHLTRFNPFRISVPFKKPTGTKFILTIYDLIPLVYPKHYPPGIKGLVKWQMNKFLINKNIDAIITISETSKKDICRFVGVDPNKVFVVRLAASETFHKINNTSLLYSIKVRYGLPKKFALYVGDINYNKNIPNLVKACKSANIQLVIVGKQAAEIDNLLKNIPFGPKDVLRKIFGIPHPQLDHLKDLDDLFNKNGVIKLGYVPDEEMTKIYNLATVYVQPSFYEGFSLPPLQAVVCGTPLAISKNQCHNEVFGDNFTYFDPANITDIAEKILKPNVDKKMIRNYSWINCAKETIAVYEKV